MIPDKRAITVLALIIASTILFGGCPPDSTGQAGGDAGTNGANNNGANNANGTANANDNANGADNTNGGDNANGTDNANGAESTGVSDLAVFPADNPWNQDVSGLPVHPNSDAYIASIGADTGLHPDFGTVWEGAPIGIPYTVVNADTPRVSVSFDYADESDPGPYPIPDDALIEGGPDADGDRHVLLVDPLEKKLYELFYAVPQGDGSWAAGSGAIFDLTSNALRPAGWTSADAAGLPIFPGLVRYDEVVERGEIAHALRFTVSQSQRAYIPPATHLASSSTDARRPPMGLRLRLRADFDISGFSPNVQVILRALKQYGMIVADNGSDWYISGAPDPRWNDDELRELGQVQGRDFEAVYTGEAVTD
jgi:hypothetical protein